MPPTPGNRVLPFFGLTFLWSWLFFALAVPAFRARGLDQAGAWPFVALLLGAYGPSLMALVMTRRETGGPGVRRLLSGLVEWRGRWPGLLLALFLPFFLRLVGLGLFVSLTRESVSLAPARAPLAFVALAAALPFGPMAEEVGWRGFAQPRLLTRFSPLVTGAVLGLAWTAWHIPLFFSPAGTSISGRPLTIGAVAFYLALLTGISLLMVWLSLVTERPLLAGLLVHVGFNAEIYRFFFDLSREAQDSVERWTLIPIWLLVAALAASGRLGLRTPDSSRAPARETATSRFD